MGRSLFLLIFTCISQAQWLNYPTPGLPRTKDGKPNLDAKMPNTRDGKPDLSGVWHVQSEPLEEKLKVSPALDERMEFPGMELSTVSKYSLNILLDYKLGEILTPEAITAVRARFATPEADRNKCLPFGMPQAVLLSEVQKIIQTPDLIVVMLELDSMTRQIYLDGRPLPVDPNPSWHGSSVGHWEKDTLVVDTVGFNGKTFFGGNLPISQGMHMTERYYRRDVGHLDVEMTFNDPKYYKKPFSVKVTHLLQPDTDILEYVCAENEKDIPHMRPSGAGRPAK